MNDSKNDASPFNRRSFLKGAGALAGTPLLPSVNAIAAPRLPLDALPELPLATPPCLEFRGPHLCLGGTWTLRLDPHGEGFAQRWFEHSIEGDSTFLPGSLDQAGFGERTKGPADGHLSRPFTYAGPAWYESTFEMPAAWLGTLVSLFLERCHWQTTAWLDGRPLGTHNSLSTPHVYEFGTDLAPGPHRITLCVDNTIKINLGASHAITEQTQGNWNGIVGSIELRSTPPVFIDHVRTFSDIPTRTSRLEILLRNVTGASATGTVAATVRDTDAHASQSIAAFTGEQTVTLNLALPHPLQLWDESQPSPYILDLHLDAAQQTQSFSQDFSTPLALRTIATRDQQFLLNGRPIFLRGTVENAIFPLTGYPPMDLDSWRRLFRIAASYGMNHMRFHSYCPPEAAFLAADEAGFLLQIELPVFSHHVLSTPGLPQFMREEGVRILETYGNHPSFTLLAMGNELKDGWDFLDSLVTEFKQLDNRRLYTYSTNNGRQAPGASSDYWVTEETKQGRLRIDRTRFGAHQNGTLYNFTRATANFHVPVVAHELGQWAVYPSYNEIDEYVGILKPRNLEVFRTQLERRGMGDLAPAFQQSSGRFAAQVYKEDIESALRTPHLGGFQLLQLSDYPGQDEALVGMLDSFWNTKCLITPEAFRRFCSSSVPLCSFEKFTWTSDETFAATVELAHYDLKPLRHAPVRWTVQDDSGRLLHSGNFAACNASPGDLVSLGKLRIPLHECAQATRLTIQVTVGSNAVNSWHIWVYPDHLPVAPTGVTVTDSFSDATSRLARGENVLLCLPADAPASPHLLKTRFLPAFWSFGMFKKQPGTLGILCNPTHPALAAFPTSMHSDWQWWDLTEGTNTFILDTLPEAISPIVQGIDDFHRNHKLGMVLEARVGKGKLLLTSLPLTADLTAHPVRRQLLFSLSCYAADPSWSPRQELSPDTIAPLFTLV